MQELANCNKQPEKNNKMRIKLLGAENIHTKVLIKLLGEQLKSDSNIIYHQQIFPLEQSSANCDLMIIDYPQFSFDNIVELLKFLSKNNLPTRVALFNTQNNDEIEPLLDWPQLAGVFHEKSCHSQVIQGIEEINNSGYWLPRELLNKLVKRFRVAPKNKVLDGKLTRREQQLLSKLLEGATNSEIAESLFVSEHTVKSHLYNIFKKIGVKNRLQAVNWAKQSLQFQEPI